MESIIINKFSNSNEKEIEVERTSSTEPDEPGEKTGNGSETGNETGNETVNFLKFSIQNILQQAAASNTASAAAAAITAAASRRSNEILQADMAAAVMSDLDMKRAMGSIPFW